MSIQSSLQHVTDAHNSKIHFIHTLIHIIDLDEAINDHMPLIILPFVSPQTETCGHR